MNGRIIRVVINNTIYFILISIVYMRSFILGLVCFVFFAITIAIEVRLYEFENRESEKIIDGLLYLDQQLRIGDSPSYAYKTMLDNLGEYAMKFKKEFYEISPYAWMLYSDLNNELKFNYRTFHNQLNLIINEIKWREQIKLIFKTNQMQLNIMKHIPLIIEMIFLHKEAVNVFIYSVSITMLLLSNSLSYYYFREIKE